MASVFRTGFLAAAAVTVFGAVTGRDRWQWAAKPLMMPLLAAEVARDPKLAATDRKVLLGSLAAATVGDVLLIDPDDDRRLIAGASSFALMQTGYATLWRRRGARPRAAVAAPRVGAWLGAAALMRAKAPTVALPLTAYGATLGTAAVLASDPELAPGARNIAGLNIPNSDPRSRLGVGALLFTLSDGLIVLRRIFARGSRSRRVSEGVILATYAGAQYLLADPRAHR
ncbi:lysoplasmalogenase [Nocardia otitidiscaviarum]|uniref:Lysoplasmalogenase n=2 Tax=Nocardia TaxID=1817 RepID=A0A516NVB3_9NOCA|nr:lysoplasmalogenase [Nocardia otitidiscaviarum]MCP9622318.1 lysoplasmalogenase [Nocardia otitidiscaviarum]QDP82856.1 lysoplasmalogenase [Nocardia otitidiscaviarum]